MAEENEIIEFELSKQLEESGVRGMMFETETNILVIKIKSEPQPIRCNIDKSSMKNTIELVYEMVDGTLDQKTKLLCIYSIRYHLRRHKIIKFADADQKWYSEAFPDDRTFIVDKVQKQKRKQGNQNQNQNLRSKRWDRWKNGKRL